MGNPKVIAWGPGVDDAPEVLDHSPATLAQGHVEAACWLQVPPEFSRINADSLDTQLTTFLAKKKVNDGSHAGNEILVQAPATQRLYQPLVEAAEIRVLEIFPGEYDQPLYGRLHHAVVDFDLQGHLVQSFKEHGDPEDYKYVTNFAVLLPGGTPVWYTALSYVWGVPNLTHSIRIGTHSVEITSNLHVALRHLRHQTHSIVLWIDQVCIDQSNLSEKERQVQLMGSIYRRAWNTVIWLGEKSYEGAFQALQDMATDREGLNQILVEEERELLRRSLPRKVQGHDAARALLSSPWFQRTWTIQEVVLWRSPYVMAGHFTCPWAECIGCCETLRALGAFDDLASGTQVWPDTFSRNRPRPLELSALDVACDLYAMSVAHVTSVERGAELLLDTLVRTRYAKVSNPHDKIFAILGLCDAKIVPDYTLPLTKVLWNATVACMRHDRDRARPVRVVPFWEGALDGSFIYFQILGCIDHPLEDESGLPSWVIDWSQPRYTHPLAVDIDSRNCFNAGGSTTVTGLNLSLDERKLTTYARVFDSIQSLSPIIMDAELTASDSTSDNVALRQCAAFALSPPRQAATQPIFAAFCKVITAGKDGTGRFTYRPEYTEVISLLCDTTSSCKPTFPDQVYTARQQSGQMTVHNLKIKTFKDVKKAFQVAMLNRRLCWTADGRLGLVPRFAQEGDKIAVIPGSAVPYIVRYVRHVDGKAEYHLIGEAYIDGVMNGEVANDAEQPLDDLVLV